MFNIPKFELPQINPEIFKDLRDPDEVTNNILSFLKEQGKMADRQFKTSRNLILATILIMIVQIGLAFWSNSELNSKQRSLNQLIETQSQQSETVSEMALSLVDLQNQVQLLEKENKELNEILNK